MSENGKDGKYGKGVRKVLSLVHHDCHVIADIGAGAGPHYHILMEKFNNPKIYSVEPDEKSRNKLEYPIDGSFRDFKVPERVDLIYFSSSWHHCTDEDMPYLFENIRKISKPNTELVFVNDFYVGWYWIIKRLLGCLRMGNLDIFAPVDGNHFRTKPQIKAIFKKYGYDIKLHRTIPNPFSGHTEDRSLLRRLRDIDRFLGWKYYYMHIKASGER